MPEKKMAYRGNDNNDPEADVQQAKLRVMVASEEFRPFGAIQDHPFISLALAFVAGFGLSRVGVRTDTPTIYSLGQIAGAVSTLAPLWKIRARSSGG